MAVTEPRPLISRPSPWGAPRCYAAGRTWLEKTTRMRHPDDENGASRPLSGALRHAPRPVCS